MKEVFKQLTNLLKEKQELILTTQSEINELQEAIISLKKVCKHNWVYKIDDHGNVEKHTIWNLMDEI